MNDLKKRILECLQNNEQPDEIEEMIQEYEAECPMDFDLYRMKAACRLLSGNAEEAYGISKEMLKKNPYNFEANLIARNVCCAKEQWIEAIHYESVLDMLSGLYPELQHGESCMDILQENMMEQGQKMIQAGDKAGIVRWKNEVAELKRNIHSIWGLFDEAYLGDASNLVGKIYTDALGNEKYNAVYNYVDWNNVIRTDDSVYEFFGNYITTKLECREAVKGRRFVLGEEAEYLLPVLSKEPVPFRLHVPDGKEFVCMNKKAEHFEYYRLPPTTEVEAERDIYFGNPIALKSDPGKKRLVLNIFVDGISQKVLEEERLAEIMPETYRFFEKGVQCTNAYSAAEWTLPSLAAYWTGVSSVNHMLILKQITKQLPENITTLAEYFKEQGYETAKIDGDWRSILPYGYGRGIDRTIYQHQYTGMRVEQVIPDVLDHMELMRETNQFIWMCVGDLHNIADGFSGNASVQGKLPLECRIIEDAGLTSVKQAYSESKRTAYIAQMKHVDSYLGILYRYIEANYKDDEIVISLFGDHGQGYLVGKDEHFLSSGRSKVGMMFRGGDVQNGVCEELVSTCDYIPILCRLAGIPLKDEGIEGRLPVFFGGDGKREYVITESIHEGDPYRAAIVSEEDAFYFTAEGVVGYDGRFTLGNYTCTLLDKTGTECHDTDRIGYYFDILMKHVGRLVIY